MVESSVKTISRPVIDRLPVNVNQIDEFACRQLDRVRLFPFFAYLPPFVIVIVVRFASAADRSHVIVLVFHEVRGDASPFPIFFGPIFVPGWFANTPLHPCSSTDIAIPPRVSNPPRPLLLPPWPSPHLHPHLHLTEIGADQN